MKGLLAACGRFEILEAVDGHDALRRAHEDRPQLIVLDLGLPDLTGFQVLDRLKSDDVTRDIPVIVNSSSKLDATESRQLREQAVSILDKGIGSREAAMVQLRDALDKAGLGRSAPGGGDR